MTIMTYPEPETPSAKWTVAEAKAKFSEVIEQARTRRPQTITRNGHPAAVVVSVEEWEAKTRRRGSLAEFLAAAPLAGLDVARQKERARLAKL